MKAQDFLGYFQSRTSQYFKFNSAKSSKSNRRRAMFREVCAVVDFLESETTKISSDFEIERIFAENLGEHLIIRAFESGRKTDFGFRTHRHGSPAKYEKGKSDAHRRR